MSAARVLTIDDDESVGAFITDVATGLGYESRHVTDYTAFREAYRSMAPTAIFVDLHMPATDGIQLLNELHRLGCQAEVFLISGYDERVLKSAREFGRSKGLHVKGVLTKPIEIDVLEACLGSLHTQPTRLDRNDIAVGLRERQFLLRYQPKLALRHDQRDVLVGAEALLRWGHPDMGELAPNRFLPLAEEALQMSGLTEYVLRTAAEQARRWQLEGLEINVAVNLSASILTDLSLPDRYAEVVATVGTDPSRITLEVTETAVMENVTDAAEVLTRFRLKGFGLSIDDFGTGFSSLVELYRMPFNELKIDQMFVSRAPGDREAAKIVEIVTHLAKELGLSVCAEGVETKETLEFLRRLDCDMVQGYLFSKPLLADEFLAMARPST